MDVIAVRGIRAYGRHGANPGERDREQPFDIDLELDVDLRAAQRSDDLRDTVDYARAHERIVEIVRTQSFALLERLAAEIAAALLEDERVHAVRVCIGKPQLLAGATPSVCVRRERAPAAR